MINVEEFDRYRTSLFGLAYRMLGSVMDAEDITQEAYLRLRDAPEGETRSPKAYLMTIVTRLCIDQLRRASYRREEYVGDWLPEPLVQSTESDPERLVEQDESISTAFLLLLESLAPLDRAVFLLHDVFNYSFSEVAAIVGRDAADCRQIGHRARQRLMQGRPRFEIDKDTVDAVVQRFLRACVGENPSELWSILAPDVTFTTDSGGKVKSSRNVVRGDNHVIRLLGAIYGKWAGTRSYRISTVNGQPAVISCDEGTPFSVTTFSVSEGKILAIYQVLNPDKLKGLNCFAK